MEITAYLKTSCGWSNGVRAILAKYDLPYEEKDILKNPEFRAEMEQRSGQRLSPCLVVDGQMLPDISGEDLENWLVANDRIQRSEAPVEVPINSSCQNKAQHVASGRDERPARPSVLHCNAAKSGGVSFVAIGDISLSKNSAGGGTRTHTGFSPLRILSPMCLPFHHAGEG